MYYFHVQHTNGNVYIVRVEHCGNMVCGVVDAEREAKRIMVEYFGYQNGRCCRDFVIKVATLEDVLSQLTFTENITYLS